MDAERDEEGMRRRLHWLLLTLAAILMAMGLWHGVNRWVQPQQLTGTGSAALGLVLLNDDGCVYVLAVSDQSKAYHAGLKPGDYILSANDMPVGNFSMLDELLLSCGDSLQLTIRRNDEELRLTLPCR